MLWLPAVVLGLLHSCSVGVESKPLDVGRRWDDLVEKHSWVVVPQGWIFEAPAPQDYTFDLHVGLKSIGMNDLIANLMEISDPAHDRYAQHLSKGEVADFMAPHPSSVEAVESWLGSHNVDRTNIGRLGGGGEWVSLRLSVADVERMLGAQYGIYHNPASGQRVIRTLAYSLPRELHQHVDVIAPTTYFGTLHSMRATSFLQPEITTLGPAVKSVIPPDPVGAIPGSCEERITPVCLRALYNTSDYVPAANTTNKIGIAGYLNEFASTSDLQTFFEQFRPEAENSGFAIVQVNNGGNDQNIPGNEANLDIQYTTAMTFPTPNVYYSTGGSPPYMPDSHTLNNTNEPYLEWLNFILDQDTIPQVISTSYGDDEQTVPREYAKKVCELFATLGSRGTTVLFSSGDFGVGGSDCKTNDGSNTTVFQPSFPASCPFVTAVGGTFKIPEVAVNFSGGGFSNYFEQPSYQKEAVKGFLDGLGKEYKGLFNRSGRAYPDVSAQANGFQVVVGGQVKSIGGTSASCPTVAGVFSLLNNYRLSMGKTSLGFINPLLYSNVGSQALNDIVFGSNPGCGTIGFKAGKGWDPVTGLGQISNSIIVITTIVFVNTYDEHSLKDIIALSSPFFGASGLRVNPKQTRYMVLENSLDHDDFPLHFKLHSSPLHASISLLARRDHSALHAAHCRSFHYSIRSRKSSSVSVSFSPTFRAVKHISRRVYAMTTTTPTPPSLRDLLTHRKPPWI